MDRVQNVKESQKASRKLKPRQRQAAYLVASGVRPAVIAGRLSLRAETLSRWKHIPAFNKEIERIMQEHRTEILHQMAHLAEASVRVLWVELQDYSSGSKRIQAALNVLKAGLLAPGNGAKAD